MICYLMFGSLRNRVWSGAYIVILKGKNEPGGGFWGCSPNVPSRPKTEEEKITVWMRILEDIGKYDWHNITLS